MYGGLQGDLPMISRVCDELLKSGRPISHINSTTPHRLSLKFNDASIDFHVYPDLLNKISKDTGIDPKLIKSTIWHCSSGLNYRFTDTENFEYFKPVWDKIHKSFTFHSKIYLEKILQNLK